MKTRQRLLRVLAAPLLFTAAVTAPAGTIRVAIGTDDTTIAGAAGGLVIRERHLLDQYLPHTGGGDRRPPRHGW